MRNYIRYLLAGLFIAILFNSCSMFFDAYLRNLTNETAVVDVFLLDKSYMRTLPNKVKVANQVVRFKSGVKNKFETSKNVDWIDISHFTFRIAPHTSVDLTDMAGRFMNGYPPRNVRVVVISKSVSDTLINGYSDFRHDNFTYANSGFMRPTLYYDIK